MTDQMPDSPARELKLATDAVRHVTSDSPGTDSAGPHLAFQLAGGTDSADPATAQDYFLALDDDTVAALQRLLSEVKPQEDVSEAASDANATEEQPQPQSQTAAAEPTASEPDSQQPGSQQPVSPQPKTSVVKHPLRPREIQDRIRAGASVEELMEFSGMSEKKIMPFAYPVLAERARIAKLGRESHPRRSDGPATLTLGEILATAFTARGHELSDAQWDAKRDATGQWIVTVTWEVGHSTNIAEWNYQDEGGHAVTVSRNAMAAELVDPDYHRTSAQERMPQAWIRSSDIATGPVADDYSDAHGAGGAAEADTDDFDEAAFLQHPEAKGEEQAGTRRKRKSVMPSWEDVLLGVRPGERNNDRRK